MNPVNTAMRHLSKNNYRVLSALFMLVIFLNYTFGCTYYKVKSKHADEIDFTEALNKSLNRRNLVLFVQGSESFLAKNVNFDQHSITADLDSIPDDLALINSAMDNSGSMRIRKGQEAIVHEVRIHTDQTIPLKTGPNTVSVTNLSRVDIYGHDTAKEILSWTAGAAAVFGVMMLIVALTKSSCPYVYSYNGEHFMFEGESYGGAIFKPLERTDFLPLKEIDTVDRIKSIKIANMLKERQFIDQVQLIEIGTPPGTGALIDKYGKAYSYQDPIPPIEAVADRQDYSRELASSGKGRFIFDSGESGPSHIDLLFPNRNHKAKLILNAKGSLWLDYMYGEFSKLFGEYYSTFIRQQDHSKATFLKKWINDQNLLLSVYEKFGPDWKLIDQFDMVGPLGEGRDLVMSIPENPDAGDLRIIRLETGFMFWELNYAALDYSPDQILGRKTLKPFRVLDHNGTDRMDLLTKDDSRYLEQTAIGDFMTAQFETTGQSRDLGKHYFLGIKGYYEHVRDFEGAPEMNQLLKFKKPGYFSEYSRRAYQSLTVDFFAVNSEVLP